MEICHKQFLFLVLLLLLTVRSQPKSPNPNNSVTAVLVFGDSTVDPGNNNFIDTIFRSNFPPYGIDFPNQQPTGRFTNGLLATDLIASYLGVKELIPPYLDPSLSIEELMSGVSFAFAGTGFDPLTPKVTNVIEMQKQVELFKEYKQRLEKAMGREKMENHISKALYVISAGTNDFVVNYFTLSIRRKTFSLPAYEQFILHSYMQFLQDLFDEGARKIIVTTLPPFGCLPLVITLFSKNDILGRGCLDYYSSVARDFNFKLNNEIGRMNHRLAGQGLKIEINDAYVLLNDMIQGPQSAAFEEVNIGCCGTGLLEVTLTCNPKSLLCPDPTKYIFWDSIHPTQQTYSNVVQSLLPIIDSLVRDP